MGELKVENKTKVGFEITRDVKNRASHVKRCKRDHQDINYYVEFIKDFWYKFYTAPQKQGIIGTILDKDGLPKYPDNWMRVAFTSMFCVKLDGGYRFKEEFMNDIAFNNESQLWVLGNLLREHRQNLILTSQLKREKEKYIKLNN